MIMKYNENIITNSSILIDNIIQLVLSGGTTEGPGGSRDPAKC